MFHSRLLVALGIVATASTVNTLAFAQASPGHRVPKVQEPLHCVLPGNAFKGKELDIQIDLDAAECLDATPSLDQEEVNAHLKDKGK